MEVWRSINGFEGKYQVSDLGRVMRIPHLDTTGRFLPQKLCKLISFNTSGHLRAALSWASKVKRESVHRLVLEAFVGPCPKGMQACHNDGDPKNNTLTNLRWDWPKENQADRHRHGTQICGEGISCAKLQESDVLRMRDMRICGATYQQIADWFNVTLTTAHRAATRKTWAHI